MHIHRQRFAGSTRCRPSLAIASALVALGWAGAALAQAADAGSGDTNAAALPAPAAASLPHNLSAWNMFAAADVVVQTVMVLLVLASVITWTILIAKTLELMGARRSLKAGLAVLSSSQNLEQAAGHVHVGRSATVHLVTAALQEAVQSADMPAEGLKERTASRLERIEVAEGRKLAQGTGILATIGSTAPFVGLFGTVWGIMNSFIGISKADTTNLAVVAPGIAEALLATALGLIAAIPAVIIYNHFARSIAAHSDRRRTGAAAGMIKAAQ
jgi:biopolymer transport protein ExbB